MPLAVRGSRTVKPGRRIRYRAAELTKAHLRRIVKRRQVSAIRLREGLKDASHVVIMVVHDEAPRVAFVREYYRRMGFTHFVLIDNESADGLVEQFEHFDDVSLFSARGAYKSARFGVDWVNHVLTRHCAGKWILHVDPDEFLVYGAGSDKTIQDVTKSLEERGRESLHTMMLDMYSDRSLPENVYTPGTDPLDVCPLYDRSGYVTMYEQIADTTWIKGGPRARLFFADVKQGPALNKTPLVRWRRHYAFIKSTHQLVPPRLNGPGRQNLDMLEGVLLHFKFLSIFSEKLASESQRQQHTNEYDAYQAVNSVTFVSELSERYRGWQTLVEHGLLRPLPLGPRASISND